MVLPLDVGYKDYVRGVGRKGSRLPEIRCPLPGCGRRLEGHGGYGRYVGSCPMWLRRALCRPCGVSHVLMPADLVAYRDLTLDELETAWEASGPTAAVRSLGEAGAPAVRRMRAVCRRLHDQVAVQVRAFVPAVGEAGLAGLSRVFGSAPGILVRLRAWLWSRLGLFFSGLTGLWRHGRPPHRGRGAPHKPW